MGGGQMPAEGRFPALNVQDVLFCSRSPEWQNIGQTQRNSHLIVQAVLYGCMQLPFKHVYS